MKPSLALLSALLAFSPAGSALETVTITAERIDNDSDIHSISVIDDIERQQPMHIYELLTSSPGSWISKGNGQEHLTAIRSPVLTGAGGCGPFLMSEDNVSLRAPGFCNVNQLFDANFEQAGRIEVLRGPGSAFHGSNAMHGVINIISPAFSAQPRTRIAAEYENTHDYGRLLLDHRSEDVIVQAHVTDDNGYKKSSGFDQQKLRYKHRQQVNDWTIVHNLNLSNLRQQTAGYVQGTNAWRDDDLRDVNTDPDAYRNASSLRYQADIRLAPSDDQLFVVTPYLRSNRMEFLMHFQPGTPLEENGHDSLGVQTAYYRPFTGNTTLVTGFDFDYSYGFLEQYQKTAVSPLFPAGEHYNFTVAASTAAMFLQSRTAWHDSLDMTLGLRYEYARYRYNNKLAANNPCANSPACRYEAPADDALNFYNWSPKFAINWRWLEHQQLFVNLAQAYRAPQTGELFRLENGQDIADIDSEKIRSAELGFSGLLGSAASYQISLYTMKKNNVIIKDSNRHTIDGQKTRHRGIEASLSTDIGQHLNISGVFSYAKHQYASDAQLLFSSAADIKNNIIDTAPRHMHKLLITLMPQDSTDIVLETVYMGSYYLDPENRYSYPGHTLFNLKYHQQLPQQWDLGIAVHNLQDKHYADRADVAPFSNTERYFIGEPRSIRIRIGKTF
ncbi:MAG TPA: TonB-dependent receptor [Pseudomonadales bacterium]